MTVCVFAWQVSQLCNARDFAELLPAQYLKIPPQLLGRVFVCLFALFGGGV